MHIVHPGAPGPQSVRREIRTRAVERQRAPAAAKGGNAAIAILQVQQPDDSRFGGFAAFRERFFIREESQRQQRAGRVVAIWNAAGQIRPGPAAGRRGSERMHFAVLLAKQPVSDRSAILFRQGWVGDRTLLGRK